MKKIYLALWAIIAGVALGGLSSCMLNCVHGSGHVVSEERKVGDFSRISISGGYKVILKQDSSMSLKITGDDNLLKYIKTEADGDRLRIYNKRNLCNNGEMTINIGIRNLDELKASGAVEVESDGKIHTQDLRFKLSGATKITMDLNAANVATTGSGATELNLKGQATSHNINISGVGHVYAFDFVVGSCEIETSGAGHCDVNVLNSLHVHSSGASEVRYRGNPSSVTNEKSGASSVEKVN
ncbi:MAG TPA: head GIN domain-containing protein [Mucilaginibacter sp.]|jgi:hypothetical protein